MKGNTVSMCLLFDYYGGMLTEKQQEIFDLYYNEDFSLAEISENLGITRQGVRDAIIRSESVLLDIESRIRLVEKFAAINLAVVEIRDIAQNIREVNQSNFFIKKINDSADRIVEITSTLTA